MYAVKEIFYTLQGEGHHAGRPAVFLRFAGCNLWTGRERDRGKGPGGCSRWCDTDFVGTNGEGGGRFASAEELSRQVSFAWKGHSARPFVVCTGGEPLLQLDAALIAALQVDNFEVAVETNGTVPVPAGLDWVCVSPKRGGKLVVERGDELKLVVPQEGMDPRDFELLNFEYFYLQPLDGLKRKQHTKAAVEYCKANPRWRLSLQTHKLVGIP